MYLLTYFTYLLIPVKVWVGGWVDLHTHYIVNLPESTTFQLWLEYFTTGYLQPRVLACKVYTRLVACIHTDAIESEICTGTRSENEVLVHSREQLYLKCYLTVLTIAADWHELIALYSINVKKLSVYNNV